MYTSNQMDKSRSFSESNFENERHATDKYEGRDYTSKLWKLTTLKSSKPTFLILSFLEYAKQLLICVDLFLILMNKPR